MEDTLFRGNREPSLEQILAEPIVQTIMRRDGTDADSVRELRQRTCAAKPLDPVRLPFIKPAVPNGGANSGATPRASNGMLAQAAAPRWPRVFPSL